MARKPRRDIRRPTDRDLQAYVDGELDPARRLEVRDALRQDAELRAIVKRYEAQRHVLRRMFDGVLTEPFPESIEALLAQPAKRRLH
jgi:anti-sigma factor RsiW